MEDIHIYDIVGDLTVPNKEVIYDCPTRVGSREDEIAAKRVEMTPNPAYRTVTCSKNAQGTYDVT